MQERRNSIALVQERCNSIANTMELHLSCTNPLIYANIKSKSSFRHLHWNNSKREIQIIIETHKIHPISHPWMDIVWRKLTCYNGAHMYFRAHTRFALSQWETALLCNNISHWLGASLESALYLLFLKTFHHVRSSEVSDYFLSQNSIM